MYVPRRLPIDNELWLEYHMSHSQSLACHTLGWPIQANPTTNPSQPNDHARPTQRWQPTRRIQTANPTIWPIQQWQSNNGQSGQLLPNQWRPTNQRRPIHQRRPTRQEASGKILRGLPSHHSSALSPLYATPTCPHCSHYWHWHRWRLWSLSSDVRGRKHAQRQRFIINDKMSKHMILRRTHLRYSLPWAP